MLFCNARRTTLTVFATVAITLFMALGFAPQQAQAQDYGWFLLDLPKGWQAEAPAEMSGMWMLTLSGPQQVVHVRILVGKTAGPPDGVDVAALLRAAAGVREPVRRADSQYTFRGKDALGVESAGIVGADPQAGLYMAVLCSGEVDLAEDLLAALRGGTNPAMLPMRHTVRGSLEPRFMPAAP